MLYQLLLKIPIFYFFLGTYFALPSLLGLVIRHQDVFCQMMAKICRSSRKTRDGLRFKSRSWTTEDYLSFTICFLMVAFGVLVFAQILTHAVKAYAVWIIVTFLAISFALLATARYKLIALYKKISWLINIALVLIGLYVANESTAICDDTIAEFTNLNASNFPSAQRALTTLIIVGHWVFYSTMCSLGVCILLMLTWVHSSLTHASRAKAKSKYIPGVTNRNLKKTSDRRGPLVNFTLTISLLYVTVTITTYFSSLTPHKIDGMAKHLLVRYSFHVSPKACGLSAPADSKVSVLTDKQAVLAIPDREETYRFVEVECKRSVEKYPETQRDLTSSFKVAHEP